MYKTTTKLRAYENPMTPKPLNTLMLQPILYTSACLEAIEEMWCLNKHKAAIKFSLPSSRETYKDTLQRTKHPSNRRWIDNWCENNINICRYKISPHKEANIHLETIKRGIRKPLNNIMLLTTKANYILSNKTVPDKLTLRRSIPSAYLLTSNSTNRALTLHISIT